LSDYFGFEVNSDGTVAVIFDSIEENIAKFEI